MIAARTTVRPRIVIVEDEVIIASDIENRLRHLDYEVAGIASSGEEAVKVVKDTLPDLVLMDIMLKNGMDGIEAAQQIRDRFDISVIYLTAYSDDEMLQRAKVTEPFGYIVKPIEERGLHSAIEMALYKHQMDKQVRASEEWLKTTLRSISDAVIATDTKGCVRFMNPVAESLTGWDQEDGGGRPLREVLEIKDEDAGVDLSDLCGQRIQEQVFEDAVLTNRQGKDIPVDGRASGIRDGQGNTSGVVLVLRDITKRKQAEATLRNQQERYQHLVEGVPDAVYAFSKRQGGTFYSSGVKSMLGYTPDHLCEHPFLWHESIHPEDLARVDQAISDFGAGKDYDIEYRIKDAQGNWRWLRDRSFGPRPQSDDHLMQGIATDITEEHENREELLRHQQQLRSLASELTVVEERERKRLAAILHDDICQLLASSKMIVDLQLDKGLPEADNQALARVGHMLEQAAEQAHDLTFALSTPLPYELGLTEAISEWLTREIEDAHHISVTYTDQGISESISEDSAVMVFRSIRELAFNAVKHAQLQKLLVTVGMQADRIVVEVIDDGIGFDYERVRQKSRKGGGFGLFSIQERLAYVGGEFTVDSERGRGTRIVLSIPSQSQPASRTGKGDV